MEGSRYPKRERKPKVAYTVPSPKQKVRKSVEKVKHRNRAADGSKENKWKTYRDMIKKSVNCLLKEMQTLEVKFEGKTAPARGKNTLWELERMECEKKIFTAKEAIVTTLQAVAHENEDHKRWPQLLDDQKDVDDGEEDDGVDVDDIYCSLCNEEETEDNDILLCDRAGCGRAYHQKCLDPPIDMMNVDPKHDWFCWQCECMDDCLDIISERLEVEYWDWKDVFPDVRMALEGVSNGEVGDTILTVDLPDDEEDDDYDPSDDDEEDGGEDENEDEDDDEEEQQQVDDEVENDDRVASDGLGEERVEDEENDEDGDDDEEMDDDGDDDDDNIDNDELQGLLEDANIPMEIVQEESEEVPISRRLRQRNQKKETVEIELLGPGDVGKFIARVRRGLFELGKILEYLPKEQINSSSADEVESNDVNVLSGHWKVRFSKKFLKEVLNHGNDEAEKEKETSETNEDMNTTEVEVEAEKSHYGDVEKEVQEAVENEGEEKSETSQKKIRDKKSEEELLLNAENITAGLLMYQDYIERLQRIESSNISQSRQKAMQELVESTGKLDEANIITSKRERKALDYAQLSLEVSTHYIMVIGAYRLVLVISCLVR